MSARVLLIEVALLGDRWHGVGDWPPSPFRLFQALVAGAYGGRWTDEDEAQKDDAFRWLERLPPPRIAAPPQAPAGEIAYFVPNNDLDAVDGDPRRVGEIRTPKLVRPRLLQPGAGFLYAFDFEDGAEEAERLCGYVERLHLFGRGVDAAFARAELLTPTDADARLNAHVGTLSRPTPGEARGAATLCATEGSLDSLKLRHRETAARFARQKTGRKLETLFRNPPKAQARPIAYDRPPRRLLYELRRPDDLQAFAPAPQAQASRLVEAIRDRAAKRLAAALPNSAALVETYLVGRGAGEGDLARRVRILALPSIGHTYASPSIRRVVVEVPPDCPLPWRDLDWALSGAPLPEFETVDAETGEVGGERVLVPSSDRGMTLHYGFDRPARRWRSVTPAALPHPTRPRDRKVDGPERARREAAGAGALAVAARHAGLNAAIVEARLQLEPFSPRGARADAFDGGRFKGRLSHAEVLFDRPVAGPLLLGDGRFVGLGLMRPVREPAPGLHLFAIDPACRPPADKAQAVAQALRRAVMARAQAVVGERAPLPAFFTGHAPDGGPLRSGRHEHLFFLAEDADGDGRLDRLAVIAPHLADRTVKAHGERLGELERALDGLTVVRAGAAGVLQLTPRAVPGVGDAVFGRASAWVARTPYRPTRHPARGAEAAAAVVEDIRAECARRGLPRPQVELLKGREGPRGGLTANARLRFAAEVEGPVCLGGGCHLGAGLFKADRS